MDAAFSLFTEVGFEGTTMDAIAKRAGASTKTLYSRYANKSELLEAVVRRNVQRTVADHLRSFALTPQDSEPREFLQRFGMQVIASLQTAETSGLTRVTFAEGHRFPILVRMYHEVIGRAVTAFAEAFRIWREQGRLEFDGDPEPLAALCFYMMSSEPRIRAVLGDAMRGAEAQRHVSLAVDTFLRGVQPIARKKK